MALGKYSYGYSSTDEATCMGMDIRFDIAACEAHDRCKWGPILYED